jgi:diaminopimelate epimerase
MKLEKYHGLGNSFLITEFKEETNYTSLSNKLCNDKLSIGADGLIVYKKEPLEIFIYNKDGSEALMCGNGLRCFVHYCYLNGLLSNKRKKIEIRTKSGIYLVDIVSTIPFQSKIEFKRGLIRKENIGLFNEMYDSYYVKVGVKHNVIFVEEDNEHKVEKLKDNLLKYGGFCEDTNIDIVTKINQNTIKVLTYERGVGFTSSCGTGCVASSLVSNYLFNCSSEIYVLNEFGKLIVTIEGSKVFIEGPSEKICSIEVIND